MEPNPRALLLALLEKNRVMAGVGAYKAKVALRVSLVAFCLSALFGTAEIVRPGFAQRARLVNSPAPQAKATPTPTPPPTQKEQEIDPDDVISVETRNRPALKRL